MRAVLTNDNGIPASDSIVPASDSVVPTSDNDSLSYGGNSWPASPKRLRGGRTTKQAALVSFLPV